MLLRRTFVPSVFAMLSAAAALLLAAAPEKGRLFALVVAVQDYSGTDLSNLKYADNDGTELADLLRQQGYRRVVLMTRSEALHKDTAELDPTADAVRLQLKSLLEDCREGDTVLVTFSGHGAQLNRDGKFYFCPRKANLDAPDTLVSLDDVYAQMKDCRASVKLLVADACRNDPLQGRAAGDPRLKTVTAPRLEKPDGGVVALFSCKEGQKSFESDDLRHGVFFYYFLKGLRGEAADPKSGEVELVDLWKYVRDEVPVTVKDQQKRPNVRQNPNLLSDLNDRVVLARIDHREAPSGATTTQPVGQLFDPAATRTGAAPPDATTTETGEREETFDYKIEGRTVQVMRSVRTPDGQEHEVAESVNVPSETRQCKRKVLTLDLGGVTMELVRIPHGTFMMGSPDSDPGAGDDEKPQHEVTITKDFYLGKYLVTQEQYKALMGANPSYFSASGLGKDKVTGLDTGRFPVEQVNWDDAQAFCQKLSDKIHRKAGLPTEAEWEYACRAGTVMRFPGGDELTVGDANFRFQLGHTCAVGSYPANQFGLYDMTGNVLEWCSDYYDLNYYNNSTKEDPENLIASDAHVARGGSWSGQPGRCRAACRARYAPALRSNIVGFRVAFRLN